MTHAHYIEARQVADAIKAEIESRIGGNVGLWGLDDWMADKIAAALVKARQTGKADEEGT